MQFTQAAVLAFLAISANAAVPKKGMHAKHTPAPNATWVTTTVTGYVTYCPESTTFNGPEQKTYTATASQGVTVTDCPKQECTITWQPKATVAPTICPIGWNGTVVAPAPAVTNGTWTAPAKPTTPATGSGSTGSGSSNSGNTGSGSSGSSGNGETNTPAEFQGAASKVAGSSAALLAVVGAFAYFL